jgi:hypothetical protein
MPSFKLIEIKFKKNYEKMTLKSKQKNPKKIILSKK